MVFFAVAYASLRASSLRVLWHSGRLYNASSSLLTYNCKLKTSDVQGGGGGGGGVDNTPSLGRFF